MEITKQHIEEMATEYAKQFDYAEDSSPFLDYIAGFEMALSLFAVSGRRTKEKKPTLNISLKEYGYTCGDGCCYDYGTITTVNGHELQCHDDDTETILKQVLEHLGYKVSFFRCIR